MGNCRDKSTVKEDIILLSPTKSVPQASSISPSFLQTPVATFLNEPNIPKEINYTSGANYIGEVFEQKPNGSGILEFQNHRFQGSFVNGMPNGTSTIAIDGNKFYEGPLVNGIPHGIGNYHLGDMVYNGDIANGVCHGMGYCRWADGTEYEGKFEDGLPNGNGLMRYTDGIVYIGRFLNGKKHGPGNFMGPNSMSLDVNFNEGELVTDEVAVNVKGRKFLASVVNGQIVVK